MRIRYFRQLARKNKGNFGEKRESWTVPALLWVIMPLEDKMHIQRNFVLNVGFGRSPTSVLKSDLKNLIQKIASWYQLALFATIANAKIS